MGRKRKPPTYSCYDAPFNPNQTSDSEDETPDKPGELKFGTILNNELRREVHTYDAPNSHNLLYHYIKDKIEPSLPSSNKPTWVPISSIIFPGDLTGRLAIISHLKDPRRALVYLIKGEKNGKDIPLCFSWQFIRIEPKMQKSGPTFKYVEAPKMCISSKKGCWLVWKEYFDSAPSCIRNSRKSKFRNVYMVPDYDTRRVTRDYERYVRGMEIPPPRSKINYTGFEQFNTDFPTEEWKNTVQPMLIEKSQRQKEKYYPSTHTHGDDDEDDDLALATSDKASFVKKSFQVHTPYKTKRETRKVSDDEEEYEDNTETECTRTTRDDGFKYNTKIDTEPNLCLITSESTEFKLLFDDKNC
jgi:hypothetical protein